MNERIKEIGKRIGIIDLGNRFYSPDFEVFAELIIKECANICKDTAENQFNPLYSRESDGATVCYKKIKEHFGIDK